jgi:hypothetical protein
MRSSDYLASSRIKYFASSFRHGMHREAQSVFSGTICLHRKVCLNVTRANLVEDLRPGFFEISDPETHNCSSFITTQDNNYLKFSSPVIDTSKFLNLNDFGGLIEFYSAPVDGSTDMSSRHCPQNTSNFTAFFTNPASDSHICAMYPVLCQSLRFVAVGISEVVAVVTIPRSQPSCLVPSNFEAPAGTYSVSRSNLHRQMLVNGDFESPALSETQTYQNFASRQQLGGWLVSTITASCFHQTNKSLAFPENPQCFVSLERNFIRRSTTLDAVANGACSIRNRLEFFLLICP